MREERSDGIMYVVEVVTADARREHRFEGFDDAKRYASDVQRLNPDVGVNLFFAADGWLSEYRKDVWLEGA